MIVLMLGADPLVKFKRMTIQYEPKCIPIFLFLSTQWMDA